MNKTQKEQVEELLLTEEWISTKDFLKMFISRGAAIICKLRKEDWKIASRQVTGKPYYEYLMILPPQEEELRLL